MCIWWDGGFEFGERNVVGEIILEFSDCCKHMVQEKIGGLITYESDARIFYFENVAFFLAKLGSDVCPRVVEFPPPYR